MFTIALIIESLCLLALALAFGFALRLPFAMHPESSKSDQWGVLGKIKKHVNLRWIDYSMPDAFPKGIFPYPMLVHFFIARFPKKYWKMLNIFINQSSDLVVAIIVYGIILYTGYSTGTPSESFSSIAWMGTLLFLSLPILLPITSRMRAHNGRCFGMLLNTLYMLSIYAAIHLGSTVAWGAGILLLLGIFLSSFFAMQTAILFSVGLAVWYLNWIPLALVGVAVLISFLFPAIGARDTLVFKVNHFLWYWNNFHKNTTATGRNLFRNFFLFFKHFPKDRVESITLFYRTSPLWIGLYSVPCFWFLAWLLAFDPTARVPLQSGIGEYCLAITVLSFIAFLLTSTGRFVIFGTAERYFEYSAPFLCVTFALVVAEKAGQAQQIFMILIVLQVATILFNDITYTKRVFRWLREPTSDAALWAKDVVHHLASMPHPVRVATIPIKLPILLRAHNKHPEKVKFYYRFIQQSLKLDAFRYFDEDIVDLNIFSGIPKDLIKKYGVTHVLCKRTYLKQGNFEFIDALFAHNIVFENKEYVLFDIQK